MAATDTHDLWDLNMNTGGDFDSIDRLGSPGNWSYLVIGGRGDMPVSQVTFWDAARFVNWLHNGKPTGFQINTTTEDGAYTLTPAGILENTVTRNADAKFFVPSEDEWYKAAYYDPGAMIYFDYPAGSDTETACAAPGASANTANCEHAVSDLTDVGSYTSSASPNGTFDQGGNLWEWNEAIIIEGVFGCTSSSGGYRGMRGGHWVGEVGFLAASLRTKNNPDGSTGTLGFRVASPVPEVPSLSPLGMAMLWGLLGVAGLRRLRA